MTGKKQMILPPLVLAVICAVCCGLLAAANALTADKIAAAEAEAIQESLQQLPDAGAFTEITDFIQVDSEDAAPEALYIDENSQAAVQITADGYNKGGLQVIVGVDKEGTVTGVAFVTVTETPGLGTKVQTQPELLLNQLIGCQQPDEVQAVDGISGATYSSNGLKAAVMCALDTVAANEEVLHR